MSNTYLKSESPANEYLARYIMNPALAAEGQEPAQVPVTVFDDMLISPVL